MITAATNPIGFSAIRAPHSAVMAGRSRPKDGVASARLCTGHLV
jgi:hypothetical protein